MVARPAPIILKRLHQVIVRPNVQKQKRREESESSRRLCLISA
jgi:hypothetical protein